MPLRTSYPLPLIVLLSGCGLGMESTFTYDSGFVDTGINSLDGGADGGGGGGDGGGGGGDGGGGGGDGGGVDPNDADRDGDGYSINEGDCDDNDASLSPLDSDGDGWSTCDGDCNDTSAVTYPGAARSDSTTACMTDADGDGWGAISPARGATAGTDCNDSDASRNPGAVDIPWDGIDQNCDGVDAGTTLTGTGSGGLAINDLGTTRSTASVGSCSEIYDITVAVNITHSYIGDLTIDLQAPSGRTVRLHNRSGGGSSSIVGTYSASGGSLSAYESVSTFVGASGSGSWALTVEDNAWLDSGTLNSWSVRLDCP